MTNNCESTRITVSTFHRLFITIALSILAGIRPGIAAADLSSVTPFDIPPQPLPSALLAYSSQSGVQITSSAEMLEGKQSPGVIGSFTARAALDRLLAGTGLRYDVVDGNTIAIRGQGVSGGSAEESRSPGGPPEQIASTGSAPTSSAPAAAASSGQPLAEVVVTGSLIG